MSDWPWTGIITCLALFCGVGLGVGGIYLLAGLGWAMLAASVPFLIVFGVLLRGLLRA